MRHVLARGLVGKYLIEALAQVPVEVDYGSEYRYRNPIVAGKELAIVITQSGETADTLAALREARRKGASSIAICNVVGSMATREADGTVYTHAGPEIGVASTKAFTSQLVALHLLALYLAQVRGTLSEAEIRRHIEELLQMPQIIEQAIKASAATEKVAERFYNRTDFLFLGRGINYPIALEGALKLKEISYIHAEGYPAGEMKHGPIALIDEQMPVVAIAPDDHVFEKMVGNVQEAKARGGSVIAITTEGDARMARVLDAQRRHPADAGDDRAAHADRDDDPAAAARVPHRRAPRLRRRSAAEPRQERHGRIDGGEWISDSPASLNPEQQEAVLQTDGALLILAGAGSGKTRVIAHRIAHLVSSGICPPDRILAVTFTNKAAEEMRTRVETLLGIDCRQMWISTFHALCARLLRREAPHIGLSRDFVIYDSTDQLTVIKQALRELGVDDARVQPRAGAVAHQPRQEPDGGAGDRSPRTPPGTRAISRSASSTGCT